jgi:hypothetical protein
MLVFRSRHHLPLLPPCHPSLMTGGKGLEGKARVIVHAVGFVVMYSHSKAHGWLLLLYTSFLESSRSCLQALLSCLLAYFALYDTKSPMP